MTTPTTPDLDPRSDDPDPDHDLVDRLFTLHPPSGPGWAALMGELRLQFTLLAHRVVATVPRTPDRTVALRSIHRACMDTIASVACNQDVTDG